MTVMEPMRKRKITMVITIIITDTVIVIIITPRMVPVPPRIHQSRKLKKSRIRLRRAFQEHRRLCKRWVKSKRLAKKTTARTNRVRW